MNNKYFNSVLIVGLGLIGSSLARALKEYDIVEKVFGLDNQIDNITYIDINIFLLVMHLQ